MRPGENTAGRLMGADHNRVIIHNPFNRQAGTSGADASCSDRIGREIMAEIKVPMKCGGTEKNGEDCTTKFQGVIGRCYLCQKKGPAIPLSIAMGNNSESYPQQDSCSKAGRADETINNLSFQCLTCEMVFGEVVQLKIHLHTHADSNKLVPTDSIACVPCKRYYANIQSLRKHVKIVHGVRREHTSEQDEGGGKVEGNSYVCMTCKSNSTSATTKPVVQPKVKTPPTSIGIHCPVCGKDLHGYTGKLFNEMRETFTSHLKSHQTDYTPVIQCMCPGCSVTFQHEDATLVKHSIRSHSLIPPTPGHEAVKSSETLSATFERLVIIFLEDHSELINMICRRNLDPPATEESRKEIRDASGVNDSTDAVNEADDSGEGNLVIVSQEDSPENSSPVTPECSSKKPPLDLQQNDQPKKKLKRLVRLQRMNSIDEERTLEATEDGKESGSCEKGMEKIDDENSEMKTLKSKAQQVRAQLHEHLLASKWNDNKMPQTSKQIDPAGKWYSKCLLCRTVFESTVDLQVHALSHRDVIKADPSRGVFGCSVCETWCFARLSELRLHLHKHHSDKGSGNSVDALSSTETASGNSPLLTSTSSLDTGKMSYLESASFVKNEDDKQVKSIAGSNYLEKENGVSSQQPMSTICTTASLTTVATADTTIATADGGISKDNERDIAKTMPSQKTDFVCRLCDATFPRHARNDLFTHMVQHAGLANAQRNHTSVMMNNLLNQPVKPQNLNEGADSPKTLPTSTRSILSRSKSLGRTSSVDKLSRMGQSLDSACSETNDGLYKCMMCGDTFTDDVSIRVHLHAHSEEFGQMSYRVQCNICSATFQRVGNLHAHLEMCRRKVKGNFVLQEKAVRFSLPPIKRTPSQPEDEDSTQVKKPRMAEFEQLLLQCRLCDTEFSDNQVLEFCNHIQNSHSLRPFSHAKNTLQLEMECGMCSQSFSHLQLSQYYTHLLQHTRPDSANTSPDNVITCKFNCDEKFTWVDVRKYFKHVCTDHLWISPSHVEKAMMVGNKIVDKVSNGEVCGNGTNHKEDGGDQRRKEKSHLHQVLCDVYSLVKNKPLYACLNCDSFFGDYKIFQHHITQHT